MSACKTLIRTSLQSHIRSYQRPFSSLPLHRPLPQGSRLVLIRPYCSSIHGSLSIETDAISTDPFQETPKNTTRAAVAELLSSTDDVGRLMKMERKKTQLGVPEKPSKWFPYLDRLRCGSVDLSSGEVLEALDPHIMGERKERLRTLARNRSYSVCLVVEGLTDFGNISAVFRSADALGIQSVHVVSFDNSKRYKDNRHISMGAEKWLDIELWDSTKECFEVLKSRGYRVATAHLEKDAVSVYDMDWSCPTAIVVGNEHRGVTNEALELSDLHCCIPMKGMVESFNVSVAAGILMHHAVSDRLSRLGYHGDLTSKEIQILSAEFSLRHSRSTVSIAHEYAKRRASISMPSL